MTDDDHARQPRAENPYYSTLNVAYATAMRAVDLAVAAGSRAGLRLVVTVVDSAMTPVAFGRADGATPHSIETSRRKAMTSASTRRPTALLPPALAVALEHGSGGILTSIKGGVPLAFNGVHVGGLGLAGGRPEEDAAIADEVLRLLGADAAVSE